MFAPFCFSCNLIAIPCRRCEWVGSTSYKKEVKKGRGKIQGKKRSCKWCLGYCHFLSDLFPSPYHHVSPAVVAIGMKKNYLRDHFHFFFHFGFINISLLCRIRARPQRLVYLGGCKERKLLLLCTLHALFTWLKKCFSVVSFCFWFLGIFPFPFF